MIPDDNYIQHLPFSISERVPLLVSDVFESYFLTITWTSVTSREVHRCTKKIRIYTTCDQCGIGINRKN